MLLFNSNPCKNQRKIMEKLGFELESTQNQNISVWELGGVVLDYDNDQVLTPHQIISDVVVNARLQGAEEAKTKFRAFLGVPSVQALHPILDR